MLNRVFHYGRERRARQQRIDEGECGLILNALNILREQRAIAIKLFGASDPHIAELDDERAGLMAQARELGAAWA